MTKPKIARIVLAEGATVTLPPPFGSKSSLSLDDTQTRGLELEWHPRGVSVYIPGMKYRHIVPDSHLKSIQEFLETETTKTLENKNTQTKPKEALAN